MLYMVYKETPKGPSLALGPAIQAMREALEALP